MIPAVKISNLSCSKDNSATEKSHVPSDDQNCSAQRESTFENNVESLESEDWLADAQNPMNWSPIRKTLTVILLVSTNFIAAMSSSAFEPALPVVMKSFDFSSGSTASLTVSIYVIGYCFGPLLVAPLSELYGHVMILYPAYILFMAALAICGSSTTLGLFIAFRVVMGFAGVIFVLMGPAIVADIIPRENRGFALSLMSTGPVVGPTLGPVMGGYIVETVSWRWIFWTTLIAFAVLFFMALVLLKETYGPVLLGKRRRKAEKESGVAMIQVAPNRNPGLLLKAAWIRPLKMLFLSPIVPFVAFYSSLANGYANIGFATIGTVFQNNYSFTAGQSGLAYFGLTAGFLLCLPTLGRISDRHMAIMEARHGDKKPEYRLQPMFIGAFLLPLGFFWYGWSLQSHTHWIVPIIGTSFIAIGIMLSYLPVQMYLVDTYTIYTASASGACTVIRSICTALLPLCANPLYDELGYGWGNSVLAFIALAFVPIAFLVLKYGERIRTNPRFQPKL